MRTRHPVVVIAGASRGIGRAAAARLARRGARLVLAARDAEALESAADVARRAGAEVATVVADLRRPDDVARIVAAAVARFGGIDAWVGASGVAAYGTVEQTPTAVYRDVLETNLLAHIDAVRQALPVLRAQRRGRIVLIGSLYSRVTSPAMSAYIASKFALLGFARSLRQELRGTALDVRIVLPATIDTPIYQRAVNMSGRSPHPLPPVVSAARVARAIERAVAGRGRREQLVGVAQSATIPLAAAAPAFFDALMIALMKTLGLRRPPRPATTGALHRAGVGPATESGGWRAPRLRALLAACAVAGIAAVALRRAD
ncbi:SDR family NAD(P)-dependent oxidoreductase [Microbacterium sp. NPDC091313]